MSRSGRISQLFFFTLEKGFSAASENLTRAAERPTNFAGCDAARPHLSVPQALEHGDSLGLGTQPLAAITRQNGWMR